MVRAPCCEKMGLKKGPWSPEEDHILVNYINLHGHANWRALPKQAGLLRCGKSCRLRWTNYLRPDIKRGNFSREEEETIIQLHQQLGNRWSAIAAKLPGRTDNEIKNVWHTHLKKRLKQSPPSGESESDKHSADADATKSDQNLKQESHHMRSTSSPSNIEPSSECSPQASSSDMSSITNMWTNNSTNVFTSIGSPSDLPEMDEDFWSEVLSADTSGTVAEVSFGAGEGVATTADPELDLQFYDQFLPMEPVDGQLESNMSGNGMGDFWYDLFTRAGDIPKLEF